MLSRCVIRSNLLLHPFDQVLNCSGRSSRLHKGIISSRTTSSESIITLKHGVFLGRFHTIPKQTCQCIPRCRCTLRQAPCNYRALSEASKKQCSIIHVKTSKQRRASKVRVRRSLLRALHLALPLSMTSHIAAVDQDIEDQDTNERRPLIQPNHVGSPVSHATRKVILYGGITVAALIAIIILVATTATMDGLPRNPRKAALAILSQTPVIVSCTSQRIAKSRI